MEEGNCEFISIGCNESKIRYDVFDSLISPYLKDARYANEINVIVDLREIFSKMFRIESDIENMDTRLVSQMIAGNIISIIGHYRWFFSNKTERLSRGEDPKYTNFFILYSERVPEIFRKVNPEYASHFEEKYVNADSKIAGYIKMAVELAKSVIEYIPHATYVDCSDFDVPCYLAQIANTTSPNVLNLVLSNNKLLGSFINNHTIMANIKGKNSSILTMTNIVKEVTGGKYDFSNQLLPVLLSMTGYERYNIDGIRGIGAIKAGKIISKALENGALADTVYYQPPFNLIKDKNIESNIDLLNRNYRIFMPIEVSLANQTTINNKLHTPDLATTAEEFQRVSDEIFPDMPLNTAALLSGELDVR